MIERLIGEGIDLLWHPRKTLWPAKIDPSQIDQVIANLRTLDLGIEHFCLIRLKLHYDFNRL